MKRILACCLVVVTLFIGVTSIPAFRNATAVPETNLAGHQASSSAHQSFLAATDLLVSAGMNNEQIRLTHSLQNFSYRLLPSLSNLFRMNHSTQLLQQKYATGTIAFQLNSANKQLDGYYLYHLRKLLI